MDKFKEEKLNAMVSNDNELNSKYNVSKDNLELMNSNMSNISDSKNIKKIDGIVTRDRSKEDYDIIWDYFTRNHINEFSKYMGYGLTEIKNIGINKFIDFMDWRSTEDIDNYKTDRIKAIPCIHCGSEFTTFQIDLGLCEKCKKVYDLIKFDEICGASEDKDPGSSAGLVMMFVYMKDFRNMFSSEFPFEEKALLCATEDDLMGAFSKDFILSFIDNADMKNKFIQVIDENLDKLNDFSKKRYESIKSILMNELDIEEAINRIKFVF